MSDTPTAGQLSATRRDYTGTAADLEGHDFAAALDDQLCVPCILCNCQGCDACVPYGEWTPGDLDCTCEGVGS